MKDEILKLRAEGLSYNQIVEKLGCSKSTISYHCGEGQKAKNKNRQKNSRRKNPLLRKIESFSSMIIFKKQNFKYENYLQSIKWKITIFMRNYQETKYNPPSFTTEDLIAKIGDNPVCYLTGTPIDIRQPSTYSLDHIIPRSKGGENTLDNANICTKQVNSSKTDMTPEEYINLCKKVLEHNGFIVVKNDNDH